MKELYQEMPMMELFEEVIKLEGGDLWDGMSSKRNKEELKLAMSVFEKRLQNLVDFFEYKKENKNA